MAATSAPPSLGQLQALVAEDRIDCVYGIVGESVSDSLAPRVVNVALAELGLAAAYVPFAVADFRDFFAHVRGPQSAVEALTVVRPHKELALELADTATEGAQRSAAANLLIREGSAWRAANTSGVVDPLLAAGFEAIGCRAAVIGCGGAGRSVAAELQRFGAAVTLVNRGAERGRFASQLLGTPLLSLSEFQPHGFELIVNATPLGERPPFNPAAIDQGSAVVDLVYLDGRETVLAAAARSRGLTVVNGRQVLAAELGRQFRLITGRCLPEEAVAMAIGERG